MSNAAEVTNLPARREQKAPIVAGAPIRAIIPQSLEEAFRLAQYVVASGLAPKDMQTPEKCLIAILHGLEIGSKPMQSLQRIAVINGRPSIYGDMAIGLVRGSGHAEYIKEWFEGDGDKFTAWCESKRKGDPFPIRSSFSVEDAKIAGLWGKVGANGKPTPWVTNPKRMLQMRARGFNLRDGYSDVLCGMYLAEELDEPEMRDVTPPAASLTPPEPPGEPTTGAPVVRPSREGKPPSGAPSASQRPAKPYAAIDAAVDEESADDSPAPFSNDEADRYLADIDQRVMAAPNLEEIEALYVEYVERAQDRLFPPDCAKVEKIFELGYERFAEGQ